MAVIAKKVSNVHLVGVAVTKCLGQHTTAAWPISQPL